MVRALGLIMTAQPTVSGRCSLPLLAWVLLAGLWASGGVQTLMQPWCSEVDTTLVGWNISSTPTATHKLCHLACLDTPGCQSANYWYRTKVCELNSVSHLNVSSRHVVERAGSVYTFTQQEAGCSLYSEPSCHNNEANSRCPDEIADPEWRLVFKGVAGTGVKLYDMWTREEWDPSNEAMCHRRDNSLYRAWRNGELNIRRVKLSLHNSTGVVAELVFNGAGSDTMDWFTQARLESSPWNDLKTADLISSNPTGNGKIFSISGHYQLDRRFFINYRYYSCNVDEGWLVVTESRKSEACGWEGETAEYPYPIIFYSTTTKIELWRDLTSGAPKVGRADSLTIHIDAE